MLGVTSMPASALTRLPVPASNRRRSRGFTIIEVAMATFVMAFGISTAIIAMQAGFKQIDLARGTTIASQIVQSEMERLRMMSWTMIAALPASESFDGATYFSTNADVSGRYTITRTVAANSAEPAKYLPVLAKTAGYKGVTGTISFDEKGDVKNGALTLYTFKAGNTAVLSMEVMAFLRDWLLKHIQGSDKALGAWLQEQKKKKVA